MSRRPLTLRLALLAGTAALLAGCGGKTRVQIAQPQACPLTLLDISTDPIPSKPPPGAATESSASASDISPDAKASPPPEPKFSTEMRLALEKYRYKPPQGAAPSRPAVAEAAPGTETAKPSEPPFERRALVLSGGGKWGSFGAGFLQAVYGNDAGWAGGPKEFAVVTGISTGALQAPFMFVATTEVPEANATSRYTATTDTLLGANDTKAGKGRTYLDDLPLAYRISRSKSVVDLHVKSAGSLSLWAGITALRKGSLGDLTGLRTRLSALVDDGMLNAIAKGADAGRKLFVGIVDFDSGRPFAVDMTMLAQEYAKAAKADKPRLIGCFHDVLVASSSEPLLAQPVFIRRQAPTKQEQDKEPTRMYMDGGVRHGVFLREVVDAAQGQTKQETTVIINGTLTPADRSGDSGWMAKWDLLGLVRRAQALVTDQLYQSSVERVRDFAVGQGVVRIKTARNYEKHVYASKTGDPVPNQSMMCKDWQKAEQNEGFPPMFMRCLTDFGKQEARADSGKPKWDLIRPEPPATK